MPQLLAELDAVGITLTPPGETSFCLSGRIRSLSTRALVDAILAIKPAALVIAQNYGMKAKIDASVSSAISDAAVLARTRVGDTVVPVRDNLFHLSYNCEAPLGERVPSDHILLFGLAGPRGVGRRPFYVKQYLHGCHIRVHPMLDLEDIDAHEYVWLLVALPPVHRLCFRRTVSLMWSFRSAANASPMAALRFELTRLIMMSRHQTASSASQR